MSSNKIRTLITIFFLFLFGISSTLKGQNIIVVKDFKTIKKNIDTLVILPSVMDIKYIDIGPTINRDTLFELRASQIISEKVFDLLNEKYKIQIKKNSNSISDKVKFDLDTLINELSYKSIETIELSNSILELTDNYRPRYYAINIFSGFYKSKAKLNQESNDLLPLNISLALFSCGNVYVHAKTESRSYLKTIIFDKLERRVIYYRHSSELGIHPKRTDTLEKYILKNYKKLYFK